MRPESENIRTSEQVQKAISDIIDLRRADAETDFDRSVALSAIRAAEEVFEDVPVTGEPKMYCETVVRNLEKLMVGYYDSDGEYSSGIADIGSVVDRVKRLLPTIVG